MLIVSSSSPSSSFSSFKEKNQFIICSFLNPIPANLKDLMTTTTTVSIKPIPAACYGPRKTLIITMTMKKQEFHKQIASQPRRRPLQLQQQQADHVQNKKHRDFGQFVAREAVLDEEYWTAAWLRAETHWENRTDDRYVKKENANERHIVLKSVVGTLDVSIRPFLLGETFPGEKVKAPIFHSTDRKEPKSQYGYIANLCVAKSARRQGIARNMLHFSIDFAVSDGAGQVYVHVHRNNIAAQELYEKIGFKVVELASPQLSRDKMYLLCYRP
ncbi:putative transcription regulator GNAT family [Helianthus annuus]|nr:putative transcription regulator GNAT family [Helianthus annuus]